ncbi:MAG: 2-polyprenyl-3-methyl-6-methoxy-1,4-benzoquinone monooxygenase [Gammaproteobacteria bacterium]|nr:2-polyprenyl-3-methyl-6-methoxy-1,4-benzoquinone monooxygenase [Gammaproteobacteria bacterium]
MGTQTNLSPLDRLLVGVDRVLRTLYGAPRGSGRTNPAGGPRAGSHGKISSAARREAGRLMRVNHSGEVAAQALYHGQSTGARDPAIADHLRKAAEEENDHLIWCRSRLTALGTTPSRLNPFWYAGSFAIGALAGRCGDRMSLGFLEETERQVVDHLDGQLERLPQEDEASRRVLQQMRVDEAHHGQAAKARGGKRPPAPVRLAMKATSRVMTTTAYWF